MLPFSSSFIDLVGRCCRAAGRAAARPYHCWERGEVGAGCGGVGFGLLNKEGRKQGTGFS
jgi:hypothetical protein